MEGVVSVTAEASEEEDECAPRGAVVGGEVGSVGVRCHHHIGIVRQLGVNAFI